MTLIVTTISDLGIVQASDSILTYTDGSLARPGKKLFQLGFCPGALGLAGSYSINGVLMDAWMPNVISGYSLSPSPTLEGFANHLAERLMNEQEAGVTALLIQIAGYVREASRSHPEMWFVRNYDGIDATTGAYIDRSDDFQVSEDFWRRDYPNRPSTARAPGRPLIHWYFNGMPEGRISFNAFNGGFWKFLESVWTQPGWHLRFPSNVIQLALLMEQELNVISTLFQVSELPAIGGPVQIETVDPPSDCIAL